MFGLYLPTWIDSYEYGPFDGSILAVVFVFVATFFITRGSKESVMLSNVLTLTKLIFLSLISILAVTMFDYENLTPMFSHGFSGVISAASILFFGYIGFDSLATLSEEAKNA